MGLCTNVHLFVCLITLCHNNFRHIADYVPMITANIFDDIYKQNERK